MSLSDKDKEKIKENVAELKEQRAILHRIDKNVAVIGSRRRGIVKPPDMETANGN